MYQIGFRCKKSDHFTKPVKNIKNGIFICHKQVNNDTTDIPQMFSKKQHFSCYRFLKIIKKYPVIISTEASRNGDWKFSMKAKG